MTVEMSTLKSKEIHMDLFDSIFSEREQVWARYVRAYENKWPERIVILKRFKELSRLLEAIPLCSRCAIGEAH